MGNFNVDKILTEEDKGAPLATVVSLLSGVPLSMARWYNYSLESVNTAKVNLNSEYFSGTLYLNGILPGDQVTIVDDTLSTGGAMIALIESVRKCGATVVDAICVVEKVNNGGKHKVYQSTGVLVKTLIQIDVHQTGITVM